MSAVLSPVPLQEHQICAACDVLARAFFDDPMTRYAMPADEHRARALPAFFSIGVRLGVGAATALVTPGAVEGVAIWMPPGLETFTSQQMRAAGVAAANAAIGQEAVRRFDRVLATWAPLRMRDMPDPHWYLMILGVAPPRQGRGIGGRLIAPTLAQADTEGRPCYLETTNARNVPFYQQHGFEVLVEGEMAGGGFRYWTMRRLPRT